MDATARHLAELQAIAVRPPLLARLVHRATQSFAWALFYIILTAFQSYMGAQWRAPRTILSRPVDTVSLLLFFPLALVSSIIILFSFRFVWRNGGRDMLRRSLAQQGQHDVTSLTNSLDADMFSRADSLKSITQAKATLGGVPATYPSARDAASPTTRIFDLDVAKTLLLMSALLYERDDEKIAIAARGDARAFLGGVEAVLNEAERPIKRMAGKWGLRFETIAELGTVGGSSASVFYTPAGTSDPFIVLAFRGPTPTNFEEYLVDTTVATVTATEFGRGQLHAGFHHSLFAPSTLGSGYGNIVEALQRTSLELGAGKKVQLWVTGHSVGGALASLVYSRLLLSLDDLGDQFELRDCFTFGAPRIGDEQLVTTIQQTLVASSTQILWSVRLANDLLSRFPPSPTDRPTSPLSLLTTFSWSQPGVSFTLTEQAPFFSVDLANFGAGDTKVLIVNAGAHVLLRGLAHDGVKAAVVGAGSYLGQKAAEKGLEWWKAKQETGAFGDPGAYFKALSRLPVEATGGIARAEVARQALARA